MALQTAFCEQRANLVFEEYHLSMLGIFCSQGVATNGQSNGAKQQH
jgi:hypothetical protein